MPVLRAQVTLPAATNLPKDAITNTWHFEHDNSLDQEIAGARIAQWLTHAYTNPIDPAVGSLSGFISGNRSGTMIIKVYALADPEPRQPITHVTFGMAGWAASDAENMPDEVALCLSYAADPVVGMSMQRLRGRIYFGPFNRQGTVGSMERPPDELRTAIREAGDYIQSEAAFDEELKWVVWSAGARNNSVSVGKPWEAGYVHPRNRPLLPPIASVVTNGWVDNAWDTQRSRGLAATGRTIFI